MLRLNPIKSVYQTQLHNHHDRHRLRRPKAGVEGQRFQGLQRGRRCRRGSIAAELADALMVALGSCFESLSGKDVTAIFELYEAEATRVQPTIAKRGWWR